MSAFSWQRQADQCCITLQKVFLRVEGGPEHAQHIMQPSCCTQQLCAVVE